MDSERLTSQDLNLFPGTKKIEENKDFLGLCYKDFASRLKSRKYYGRVIVGILIAQNTLVAFFVYFLAHWHLDEIPKLQIFLSILMSGTLAETYFTFNHVVKWLFNDVDYKSFINLEK